MFCRYFFPLFFYRVHFFGFCHFSRWIIKFFIQPEQMRKFKPVNNLPKVCVEILILKIKLKFWNYNCISNIILFNWCVFRSWLNFTRNVWTGTRTTSKGLIRTGPFIVQRYEATFMNFFFCAWKFDLMYFILIFGWFQIVKNASWGA